MLRGLYYVLEALLCLLLVTKDSFVFCPLNLT